MNIKIFRILEMLSQQFFVEHLLLQSNDNLFVVAWGAVIKGLNAVKMPMNSRTLLDSVGASIGLALPNLRNLKSN